jgi:hypothetical protein
MIINEETAKILLLFIGGLVIFINGFITLRKKRTIENIPTSKVRGLALGLAELHGKAVPDNTIKTVSKAAGSEVLSPLSKKNCIYYCVYIDKWQWDFEGSKWKRKHFDIFKMPFYLKDETGKILIDPKNAQINLQRTFYEKGNISSVSASLKEYIKYHNLTEKLGNSKIQCEEYAIFSNQDIYIMGYAEPLEQKKSTIGHENLTMKQKSGGMFFIYDKLEKDILKKLEKSALYQIFGGAALSIISLAGMFV